MIIKVRVKVKVRVKINITWIILVNNKSNQDYLELLLILIYLNLCKCFDNQHLTVLNADSLIFCRGHSANLLKIDIYIYFKILL